MARNDGDSWSPMQVVEEIQDLYKETTGQETFPWEGFSKFERRVANLIKEAQARAWREGVNDQWKNQPQGVRVLEQRNPYRKVSESEYLTQVVKEFHEAAIQSLTKEEE